ncbi:MAG: hypothetical protein K2M97_06845 [Muribaculaceae bacterium]|nr:hypothetical protein [Muribaculaceae bacterium]
MSKLHLFNPENDLALAAATANYTPPRAARELHRAGALLPLWYAEPGDCVYAPEADAEAVERLSARYGLGVSVGTAGDPAPWGWSANAVRQFRRIGSDGPFPDVELYRQLSHRRTAMLLHRALQDALPYRLPASPMEITDVAQLPYGRDFFIKAPWSGSGRGVADASLLPRRQGERLCAGIIARQGSVMVEPKLDKIRDFALLYMVEPDGRVRYRGLSLFFNGSANAYGGNIVAPPGRLAELLAADYISETAAVVAAALEPIVSGYTGPVGVDMMLYRGDDGSQTICPTVEVNMRMTMGAVALSLARHGFSGNFTIAPAADGSFSFPLLPMI